MDTRVEQTAKLILSEIAKARAYSDVPEPHDLFLSAETIISGLASLIGPMMSLETAYRQAIVNYMDEGDSHAKAEAKAKAGVAYAEYKKLDYVMKLAEAQTQLIKKFAQDLQMERRRS